MVKTAFIQRNKRNYSVIKILSVISGFLLMLVGCSTSSSSFEKNAKHLSFKVGSIQGLNLKLTIFENQIPSNDNNILHVYLGGDGTPWFKGQYITEDPTPLNPVMLNLMKLDKTTAVYLGRPCYHNHYMPQVCNKTLWSNKRYSPFVVKNMVTALKKYIEKRNIQEVKLFGFSGGGALAMLIAPRVKNISTVVTLAGNLDIHAWSVHHGYLPLSGSLNPAKHPILPLNIRQIHFVGLEDKIVPIHIIKPTVNRQRNAQLIELDNVDHNCCWQSIWPSILNKL